MSLVTRAPTAKARSIYRQRERGELTAHVLQFAVVRTANLGRQAPGAGPRFSKIDPLAPGRFLFTGTSPGRHCPVVIVPPPTAGRVLT
jgi:hypothetical protein